jgi:hypothetical protein
MYIRMEALKGRYRDTGEIFSLLVKRLMKLDCTEAFLPRLLAAAGAIERHSLAAVGGMTGSETDRTARHRTRDILAVWEFSPNE